MASNSAERFTFENLLVDAGNRVAAAAGRRAAESPGTSYNPLLITGPAGVGKSHLLGAVEHRARELNPSIRLLNESLDTTLDRASESIFAGRTGQFREVFADLDLLILDDLHRIAGMDRVQAELFRVIEEMVRRGAQVVIASEHAPQDIASLDPGLAAQLVSGLTVDIAPADQDTRLRLARRFSEERGGVLQDELLATLASMEIRGSHELRGALNRIVAETELGGRDLQSSDLPRLLNIEPPPARADGDEFDTFLSDISTAVAALVETSPWRRRLARAILSWEGEGFRTRRLEEALDADDAPDVDTLLEGFAADVARLRQIGRSLPADLADPGVLLDPDRVREAEALLASAERARPRQTAAMLRPVRPVRPEGTHDEWYRNTEKIAWGWLALEDRITEEKG
jgi:hypothetical protein